jgi:hypothetical protein
MHEEIFIFVVVIKTEMPGHKVWSLMNPQKVKGKYMFVGFMTNLLILSQFG